MTNPEYMPQLDALRFFAILGVLIAHGWQPKGLPWIFANFDGGFFGVRLFFVLSGFLITGILLRCRKLADTSSQGSMFFVQRFYIRRFLRICPIYYTVVVAGLIVNLTPAREIWMWLVTYTSNIYTALYGQWTGRFGHFWTLAVEEQFYFVWPWLVLFVPWRLLSPVLCAIISLGPLYRYYALQNFGDGAMERCTLPFASLDTLGSGALLALLVHSSIDREKTDAYLSRIVLPIGGVSYLFLHLAYYYRLSTGALDVFGDLAIALVFCWLIASASRRFKGIFGRLLEFRPLAYLGKISYGIYVYHLFVPKIFIFIFPKIGLEYHRANFPHFVLTSVVTVIIAALSWHAFEQPINRLKKRFGYMQPPISQN